MGDIEYYVRGRASTAARRAGVSAAEQADKLARTDPRTDVAAWQKGAAGERAVEIPLNQLRDAGWYVFHDLTIGSRGANVDHLVIGRAGIFSINTKNLSGKVWVAPRSMYYNQYRTNYLPKTRQEADRVAERLQRRGLATNVRVTPVLALFCTKMTIKEMPSDVFVVRAEHLASWLTSRPPVMAAEDARRIAVAADDPKTWLLG